jgi:HSP20 family molecular chaperone IbpA
MVEALHGKVNPDGLTIPLLGVSAEDVTLFTKIDGERTMLKLVVQDGDNEPLEREMPLPDADSEVSANYINGRLHLRW